jgi:hypothetical protein
VVVRNNCGCRGLAKVSPGHNFAWIDCLPSQVPNQALEYFIGTLDTGWSESVTGRHSQPPIAPTFNGALRRAIFIEEGWTSSRATGGIDAFSLVTKACLHDSLQFTRRSSVA